MGLFTFESLKMSLEPKKSGGPIQKFWDSSEIITHLEGVKGWLGKNAKKVGERERYHQYGTINDQ